MINTVIFFSTSIVLFIICFWLLIPKIISLINKDFNLKDNNFSKIYCTVRNVLFYILLLYSSLTALLMFVYDTSYTEPNKDVVIEESRQTKSKTKEEVYELNDDLSKNIKQKLNKDLKDSQQESYDDFQNFINSTNSTITRG